MNAIVDQALELWGFAGAKYHLVAARENSVFQVSIRSDKFALRLHRQGYRTGQELWSELKWMETVEGAGLSVPRPIISTSGDVLHIIDGVQVDCLSWLSGTTLDEAMAQQSTNDVWASFRSLGAAMAQLHAASDDWVRPSGFTRCTWDIDGLVGPAPLWDRFWDNSALSHDERRLLIKLRDKAGKDLARFGPDLDYGLIHADLVSANVMVDGPDIHLIDFDDGGFGFRLFDIATTLLKHMGTPDYPALKKSLLDGYTSVRDLDLDELELFLVLRAATYVGWNINRMNEDGATKRNGRFIETATQLARAYLQE